ncbi:MAG: type II secretion system protein GspN, partial [Thermodesulfobacteriota bacterium]
MMRVIRLTDKQKKILAYGAYAVVMAAIFAWLLFPNRAVCDLVEKNAGRVHPDLAVRVADAGPGFPPGLVLRNVSVYFRDQHYGDFRYVRISPSFLSLLGAGRSFAFKARIMDGGVKGVCRQDKTTGKWAIDMAFSNVGLEAMAFLNQLPVRQITGTADGTINGDLDGRQTSVRADLVLSGV